MENLNTVLIAIQARSTSTRLPGKHAELIGGKRMTDHVLEACERSKMYLNRLSQKYGYQTEVALLVPYSDPLIDLYTGRVHIIEGPERDVLSRYKMASDAFRPEYIVRVTGDCPLIPPHIISKHVVVAYKNHYDYVSNVDERFRMTQDGFDCEVMSRRLLDWLYNTAADQAEREHVTLLARRRRPPWAKMGFIAGHFDLSELKYSVDTPEDLARVREQYDRTQKRVRDAQAEFGIQSVHRY